MSEVHHIFHLTVLNPAIHTRIFYKLALSQLKLGYRVSIAGQGEEKAPFEQEGIQIYPTGRFSRFSGKRLLIGWRFLSLVLKRKADLVIVHSPELLWVALLLKWLWKKSVIYDVHEDYKANLLAASPHRKVAANFFRKLESFSAQHLDGVAYAESCYDNILGITETRKLILRNSFPFRLIQEQPSLKPFPFPYLLYTGTIAPAWGIWDSIAVWRKLQKIMDIHLVIAGFSYNQKLLAQLKSELGQIESAKGQVHIIGGDTYVPYTQILHLIQHCWAGLGLYQPLAHLREKIPTKFFEYGALGKPLLFNPTDEWMQANAELAFGIPYRENMEASVLAEHIKNWKAIRPSNICSWEENEEPLLQEWLIRLTQPTIESKQKPR